MLPRLLLKSRASRARMLASSPQKLGLAQYQQPHFPYSPRSSFNNLRVDSRAGDRTGPIPTPLRAGTPPGSLRNLSRLYSTTAADSRNQQGGKRGGDQEQSWIEHPSWRGLVLASAVVVLANGAVIPLYSYLRYGSKDVKDESAPPTYGTPADFKNAIEQLEKELGRKKVSTDEDDLKLHGMTDQAHHNVILHSVIVYPESTEDVVKIVKTATRYRIPVIPFSGATSLEGQINGHPTGGICVDLSGMDEVLEIHEADSDLVCQPGARWLDINEMLKDKGIPLFFPIDPAPGATIGGMLSTGCSGTNAVRYGTAKAEWFLNATVVLPSGEVIKTRQRSRKSSAGWDVTKLFIGAEGTLGIVTEVTIRLAPVLPTTVAVVQFPDVKKATEAVIEVMNQGVGIQCVELVDSVFMGAINKYNASATTRGRLTSLPSTKSPSSTTTTAAATSNSAAATYRIWPEHDSLFFKFQGPTPSSLAETAQIVQRIAKKHGALNFSLAENDNEATELWNYRKNAHWAGLALRDGEAGVGSGEGEAQIRGWPTDVCVPVSALPALILATKASLQSLGLVSTIVGHVGDGNFHALILFKDNDTREIAACKAAVHDMVKKAIELEGTCTGEHGVGIGKREYLVEELGLGTVGVMRTVKKALDPLGLFNPGKLYPDEEQIRGWKQKKGERE